jgi:tetratricopeptide (TPR) repeat protein
VLIGAGGAVLLACAALTYRQAGYWQDTQHLFQHALDVTQNNYMAHNDLAGDLLNRGKLDEAIEHYQASLAIAPGQGHALEIHCVLADAMIKRGRFGEAAEQLETVLSAHPEDEPALVQLGIARARQGRPDEAVRAFAEALRLQPNDAAAHNSFGNALAQQGKHEEAVRQFEEAVRLKPDHAGAHNNLAISLSKLGRAGEAISQYREAIRWQPDFLAALNNLAWMLAAQPEAKLRNGAEAVELATRACELTKYRNPVTMTTLAAAYGEAGKLPEAISLAEQAQGLTAGANSAAAARLRAMLEAFHAGQAYHGE